MGLLRLILAISVVISHSEPILGFKLVGGQLAVQAFYIISGFYMSLILNEKYIGVNNSYKLFITNRFLRLYPIYWTVLLLTILLSLIAFWYKGSSSYFDHCIKYFDSMSFGSILFLTFTNIFLFFQDMTVFLALDSSSGNLFFTSGHTDIGPMTSTFLFVPQAWTIGLELAFYLIAPLIVRRKTKYIALMIALSLTIRVVLYYHFHLNYDPWTYRFFPTELVLFLAGILAYRLYKKLSLMTIKTIYLKIIWGFILVFTIVYGFLPTNKYGYVYLVSFFICIPFIFILTKSWKYDRYIGELSYPVYISHMLVLMGIVSLKLPIYGGLGMYTVVLTIFVSIALNELISKNIEQRRQRRIIIPNKESTGNL